MHNTLQQYDSDCDMCEFRSSHSLCNDNNNHLDRMRFKTADQAGFIPSCLHFRIVRNVILQYGLRSFNYYEYRICFYFVFDDCTFSCDNWNQSICSAFIISARLPTIITNL